MTQCPKCKTELETTALKCTKCGTRVASVCKNCGTINPINAANCSNCGNVLLRICPNCNAANLPEAASCRKCGKDFTIQPISPPKYNAEKDSQQKVKTELVKAIIDGNTKVITLCGDSGTGKNLILRYVINELKSTNLIWLKGTCTQLTQLSPFGYFQDLLINFFNINNFCPDTLQLKKNSLKFFRQDFPSLSNLEINNLLNLLYPENIDIYENIYQNKAKTFLMLKKAIYTIIEKVKAIFVIDNFENIDGMSYDFLKELLKDNYVLERCKFIILTHNEKPGIGFINTPSLSADNYKDFALAPFTAIQAEALLAQYKNLNFKREYIKNIVKISSGIPASIEQCVMLFKDFNRNGLKHIKAENLEKIINIRLEILKKEDYDAYKVLIALSVLGPKFYPAMLDNFDNIQPQEYERIVETLVQRGYINQVDTLSFKFKSQNIWKIIVSIVKNDQIFESILTQLYEVISRYKHSSIAILGYILQKLNSSNQAFDVWTQLMKYAAYVGDIGLYIVVQKQALKIIEDKNSQYYNKIKKNIYTRVGKLLEPINHKESFEYLQNAIMMLDDDEELEHIELLGYLSSVSMKNGNYWGAIECTESVLSKLPENMDFERALIKSREVRPLVRLGNYGQVVNLVDTEILPVIEKVLYKGKNTPSITNKELFDIWIEVYFDFAEALTFQGDKRAFETIKVIYEIINKNKITQEAILCKADLLMALANSVKGDINTSEKILDDILKNYTLDNMDSFIVSRWNFIDILNKFLKKDYSCLYAELFNVVAYANNVNDNFTKNILKTMLAKILQDKNDIKKALEILEEQVAYFAKEKVATGVLLSWYLIAQARLVTKGTQFALDIATKALDIAQSPNINNYYFMALFNRLIGEIYIAKQDCESAKVYIEKSIFIAKQFNLQDILVRDYIQYAKLYQELALPKSSMRATYIKQTLSMFQMAKNMPLTVSHPHLQREIKNEVSVLNSFCKLNGIVLKKSSK